MSTIPNDRKFNENLVYGNEQKHKEWINILDRYLINYYNGVHNITQSEKECKEKYINPNVLLSIRISNLTQTSTNADIDTYISTIPKHNDLLHILQKKFEHVSSIENKKCIIRYYNLGFNGQQWSSTSGFKLKLKSIHPNIHEAFASPFNCTFTDAYFSLFLDDRVFGSKGNFFDNKDYTIPLYVNPPFAPIILEKLPNILSNYKSYILIVPTWSDAAWYKQILSTSNFCYSKNNGSITYEHNGALFKPHFKTTIFGKDPNKKKLDNLYEIVSNIE